MRASARVLAAVAAASLCACQSSTPVAATCGPLGLDAGASRTVAARTLVRLAGSVAGAVGEVAYLWRLEGVPAGSGAALSSSTAANASFTADVAGVYVATLVVRDACGADATGVVVITATEAAPPLACSSTPLAVASPGQRANKRAIVPLAGSAEGAQGAVGYRWQLLSAPAGSLAMIASSTAATAMLSTDLSGTYLASLTVRDACETSAPIFTVVTVADRAPVASAGAGQTLMPGGRATLDGSGSSDPDQDPLTFSWSLTSQPAGSRAALSSGSAPSPTLVPDVYGTYVAQLLVSDGELTSAPAAVVLQVGVTGPNGTCAPAAPPTASAGPDQSISTYYGAAQLDGTGSTTGRPAPLAYKWSLSSSPAGSAPSLSSSTASRPTLSFSLPGTYEVALVVNDGCVDSATSTVTLTKPNSAPTVSVYGPYATVPILVPVQLQAFASDWDGPSLTYRWQLTGAPAGSTAAISSATATLPTLTPDQAGTYSFAVSVSDGLATSAAFGSFVATNLPPTVGTGGDRAAFVGAAVSLDGTGSSDASRRPLGFAWSLQAPTGSAAALSSRTSATSSFTPDRPGRYQAQLTVSAGGLTATGAATIAVWPAPARLGHGVLDAAYSTALDRVVMVSADPSALYLYDPRGPAETIVPLPLAPSSLSLSPDGRSAAVGHVNAVSLIDLAAATTTMVIPVSADVGAVTLGDNGFAYVLPRNSSSERVHLVVVPLGPGAQPSFTSALVGPAVARVRPLAGTLYLTAAASSYYSSSPVEEYTLPGGAPLLANPAGAAYLDTCGSLWLSRAGDRLFTRCGAALVASSVPSADLTRIAPLARTVNSSLLLRHFDDSAAAGELSAISSLEAPSYSYSTPPDDQTVRRWSADGLVSREVLPFPSEPVGGTNFAWSGRYVFYRSDGSERYVILQLAPGAGAAHDFAIVTY